jgi:hypothetical protein
MPHYGASKISFTENITFATWRLRRTQHSPNQHIFNDYSPVAKRRRGRYEEVEFDVPGVVRTKRCRVDITLDFVTKEVADMYKCGTGQHWKRYILMDSFALVLIYFSQLAGLRG